MTQPTGTITTEAPTAASLMRCLDCTRSLGGSTVCPCCGRSYPVEDGIIAAIGPLTGTNKIAAAFYDGPGWPRFRPWERLFLWFQGGSKRARRPILKYLPQSASARVLEVGIGEGENLRWLPANWEVYGVDIARRPLKA